MMQERSETDRVFRNRMYLLIGVLVIGYFFLKTWHISVALDIWDAQKLLIDVEGAAK
jgi:hypothetical protein